METKAKYGVTGDAGLSVKPYDVHVFIHDYFEHRENAGEVDAMFLEHTL